jgi:hypothetical protein
VTKSDTAAARVAATKEASATTPTPTTIPSLFDTPETYR